MVTAGGPTDEFVSDSNAIRISSGLMFKDLTSPDVFAIKPGDALTIMGGHGIILEPDVQDLKNKLTQLIQHPQREEIVNKLRNAEKNLYPWEVIATSYHALINKIDIESLPVRQLPLTKRHKKSTIRATDEKQFHCYVVQHCASWMALCHSDCIRSKGD